MISSLMEEIMRRFSEKAKDRGTEVHGVGDKGTHVARGSDKTDEVQTVQPNVDRKGKGKINPIEDIGIPYSLQSPSFDLGIGYTQPDDVYSVDIQKHVDSIISDVLTVIKSVQVEGSTSLDGRSELPVKRVSRPARILQSPFVVGEGKLFKYDDYVIVFEYFKGDIEEVDRSTFMSWFQRGLKPKNKKKFNDKDDKIKPTFVIGSFPVGHKTWFYNLIHTESSLSSTEPGSKELKVYIDSTLPQQTNGHDCRVFVTLHALYILSDGRCSISHIFDINKCKLGITALLYKYREMYVKHAKQGLMEEGMVIE
ncbi:Hypothetical predicted protein [Olea europaea subsp. europaea]|uniref:Ubiquitin-like protease family profile domain-containing protein n=1 Tax=Olea europaea subsp. europaea TaxID=158383 RepID=A0A8S0SZ29_OLEEU|nr:Hypothetical predicted protein [Olea europaea subsp. europaea]